MFLIAPIIGALLSAGASGLWSTIQTIFANKYNSPAAQKRRLRKAGLPLAYMYQGRVDQQSEVPKLSIDPDLGVVEQNQLGIQGKLTDEQIKKLEEEIHKLWPEIDMANAKRDWYLNEGTVTPEGDTRNNLQQEMDRNKDINIMDQFIKRNDKALSDIAYQVEDQLFKEGIPQETRIQNKNRIVQQIANMVKQSELMEQLKKIRGVDEQINSVIGKALENEDDWATILYAGLLKLMSGYGFK